MGVALDVQLEGLLYACGLGFWLGLYYELFRTLRLLIPPSPKSCFFQDVFFCLSAALCTFFCFLAVADGRMYLYLFVGEITGFFVFYCTLGRVFHTVLATVLRWLVTVMKTVWRRLARSLAGSWDFLGRQLQRPARFLRKRMQETHEKIRLFFKKPLKSDKRV